MARLGPTLAFTSKSRANIPVKPITDAEHIEEIAELVREVIQCYRARGQKSEEAMENAAGDLAISPRRVEMFKDREVYTMKPAEVKAIRAGHYEALTMQAAWHLARWRQMQERLSECNRTLFSDGPVEDLALSRIGKRP